MSCSPTYGVPVLKIRRKEAPEWHTEIPSTSGTGYWYGEGLDVMLIQLFGSKESITAFGRMPTCGFELPLAHNDRFQCALIHPPDPKDGSCDVVRVKDAVHAAYCHLEQSVWRAIAFAHEDSDIDNVDCEYRDTMIDMPPLPQFNLRMSLLLSALKHQTSLHSFVQHTVGNMAAGALIIDQLKGRKSKHEQSN